MTAVLDEITTTATDEPPPSKPPWAARAAALSIDYLPGLALITCAGLVAAASEQWTWSWWVQVAVAAVTAAAVLVNRVVLPPLVGWTLGRAVCGLRVTRSSEPDVGGAGSASVSASGATSASTSRLAVREVAHLLDVASVGVGWCWPLVDDRGRTFADLLAGTRVRRVDSPTGARGRAGIVVALAALLCVGSVGLGALTVTLPERRDAQARAEIAEIGPRMVEQTLSYGSQTADADFARAQSLITDRYRDELTAQQDAQRKGKLTSNEYWAVSSAVIRADTDRAELLVALQGQRGDDQATLKFSSATVQVDFDHAGGRWRIANLVVLKRPLMQMVGP